MAAQTFLQQAAETNLVSKPTTMGFMILVRGSGVQSQYSVICLFLQHEFVQRLSAVLVTVGASPVARMAAGLQLKNQLTSKDPDMKFQYQQRWLTVPVETREYIKKNVRNPLFVALSHIIKISIYLILCRDDTLSSIENITNVYYSK